MIRAKDIIEAVIKKPSLDEQTEKFLSLFHEEIPRVRLGRLFETDSVLFYTELSFIKLGSSEYESVINLMFDWFVATFPQVTPGFTKLFGHYNEKREKMGVIFEYQKSGVIFDIWADPARNGIRMEVFINKTFFDQDVIFSLEFISPLGTLFNSFISAKNRMVSAVVRYSPQPNPVDIEELVKKITSNKQGLPIEFKLNKLVSVYDLILFFDIEGLGLGLQRNLELVKELANNYHTLIVGKLKPVCGKQYSDRAPEISSDGNTGVTAEVGMFVIYNTESYLDLVIVGGISNDFYNLKRLSSSEIRIICRIRRVDDLWSLPDKKISEVNDAIMDTFVSYKRMINQIKNKPTKKTNADW
jgi:hypothetical protein